ncbi:MAG TPA: phage tail tip lysozyme, partial [Candidatus Limnocylindrales bacterium]|nr:phage tail tip lysozyme [Candidatus Limnocylindrales bacterium]
MKIMDTSWASIKRKSGIAVLLLGLMSQFLIGGTVAALPECDLKSIYQTSEHFVANDCDRVAASCSANLDGNNNAEKVWNFLTAPGRLQPWQAAGVMGNMEAESHYEPRLVQYGKKNTRNETSQQGQPSSLDDTPPAGSDTGYGIVQFTPGTKILPAANRLGMAPNDLGFQLTLLWEQLEGKSEIPEKPAGDHLKQTKTVEEATASFETKYERHAPDASDTVRLGFARDRMAQFGSGAKASPGGATSSCGGGNFSYGKYAGLTRQQLINIILNAPNWKPQGPGPNQDIQSGAAKDDLLRLIAAMLESLPGEQ